MVPPFEPLDSFDKVVIRLTAITGTAIKLNKRVKMVATKSKISFKLSLAI